MSEKVNTQRLEIYCDIGETMATVLIALRADLRDNVQSFVRQPCPGCKRWNFKKISSIEQDVREESLEKFGSDAESITGIREGRENILV